MTKTEVLEQVATIKAATVEATKSKASAIAFLQRAGLLEVKSSAKRNRKTNKPR